jgi:polyhydroxybutyrate depolymerase
MKLTTYLFRYLALSMAVLFLSGCTDDGSTEITAATDDQGMLRRVIAHDGIEREYFIHVPGNASGPLPLVVAIHGYTSTATGFQVAHDLNPHADENGYIVVYPQGSHFSAEAPDGNSYRVTSWNDLASNLDPKPEGPHCVADADEYPCPPECGSCNRCAWTSCYDDVGFIEKMMDAVQAEFSPDPRRVYLLGVSNGGMMALRLGCTLSDRFVAVAPIIAQLAPGYACGPSVDMPMVHLFGGKDNTVRPDGMPASDGFIYTTAERSTEVWAEAMSCKEGPAPWANEYSRKIGLTCSAYTDCSVAGHEVVSCMDPEGRHEWPGQRVVSVPPTCVTPEQYDSIPGQAHCPESQGELMRDGMDLVWDFFSRYQRPAAR